ncbi:hypothetical protein C4D60_Mb06t03880 [Musa balbisiana]|uniref:Glycosyltransferase 2-like domain-containing protein n=1 Tax=Musa balbisiana TaxID=52838 RepID=A0A4S8IMV9_MUSBA|nr:hypothetical protein C4D60_Mb06t03880 [Musa balbisiana]
MSACNAEHAFFDLAVSFDEASAVLFGIAWDALPNQIGLLWMWVRGRVVVPLVRIAIVLCLVMSIILLIEKVSMGLVSLYVKVFRRKPEKIYKWEAIQADEELGSSVHPMVLVQVPMFNEREVYKLSVGAVCSLSWPPDRLIIQVLDDSTDLAIREMVRSECEKWISKGITVHYISRDNRNGYKAGAMKEAMEIDYVRQCDYVAIFDADFQPASDFLVRTVPFLMHNPEIALVQARWKFVRASLAGWKFLYVGNVKVKNELPSTFKAYRFQQHRWSCGPANLFKKMAVEIITAKKVSMVKKFFMLYNFFFARRVIAHNVTFFFYCMIIPLSCFFPEIQIPKWGVIYIPTAITLLTAVATPSSIHLIIFWILFENVMSWHRCKAVFIGLTEANRVNEWIVTEKLGDTMKTKPAAAAAAPKKSKTKCWERIQFDEIGIGVFLVACATYDFVHNTERYFMYIYPLALSFILMGVGYAGTCVPGGGK